MHDFFFTFGSTGILLVVKVLDEGFVFAPLSHDPLFSFSFFSTANKFVFSLVSI